MLADARCTKSTRPACRWPSRTPGFALERGVGLTTPTTLMLTLRTVEHIWSVERRESNAMEIASRAGALYDKVAGFVDSMEAVGRALDQASRAHGQAVDRLSRPRTCSWSFSRSRHGHFQQ